MLIAIDNHAYMKELTDDVMNNPRLLDGMHVETLSKLTSYAIERDDFRVLDLLTEIHTGIPMKSDYLPEWWLSDFHDDITIVKFEHRKHSKQIRWCDITLDDGELLTSEKHKPLLNAFKYWLIACDNPLENGGKLISSSSASKKFNTILTLINTILINGETLKLSKFHLQNATESFWLKVLVTIAEHTGSITNNLYQVNERIRNLLNNVEVPTEEVEAFQARYPYVKRKLASDEIILNLKDSVKASCWLHQQSYYAKAARDKFGHAVPQGNNAVLIALLFEGKILIDGIKVASFPELMLKAPSIYTEYNAVDNKETGGGVSKENLRLWLNAIQLINTNIDKSDACTIKPVTDDVSINVIQSLTTLRKQGRTRTLPPEFVFDLFRNSYELLGHFCPPPNEGGANFWDNMLELLTEASKQSAEPLSNPHRPHYNSKVFDEALHRHLPQTELGHWLKFEAINTVHPEFLKKGILQFETIPWNAENRYARIRNNESMLDLFSVLQGAVQLLLGSIMARRVDELVSLKSYGNLVFIKENGKLTNEANPYNASAERWYLRFKVKKTGVKAKNIKVNRPIPACIARFVWQLEQFNQKAIEQGVAQNDVLSLFNNIDTQTFKLKKCNAARFNSVFDALCDYFETAVVEMDNGEYRRHYVRQHQLRRFFALVFFWSKSYENMEALRWMLAHSDLEHLHHYITESDTGAVINSAKASTIVQSVISDKSLIENYDEVEKLREMIAKRVSGDASKMLHIKTLDEAIFDYEEENEYSTIPHISQLQAEQELENEVLTLLENDVISLEPEFFTVKNEDGEDIKTFNLILKVNQLEAEL
ncbi:integrase [Vibrio vulnificus]|uniref:integrase n=1 Tax=Vibrio vulnificus TaxID=672 RepID=UPI00324270AB